MGLGCGMSMIKYLLFVFNLLCCLCGIALIAVGSIVLVSIENLSEVFESFELKWTPIVLIVVGCVILVISFFGCCGAVRESTCMIMTYSSFIMILLLVKVAIGVYVIVNSVDFQNEILKAYDRIWVNADLNPDEKPMGTLQQILKCCGNDGPGDYGSGLMYPFTCCPIESRDSISVCASPNNFERGCRSTVYNFVEYSSELISIIALSVAGVELIGFIFSCCLASSIRSNRQRYA